MASSITLPYASGIYTYRNEHNCYIVDNKKLKLIVKYAVKNNRTYAPALWKQICKVNPIKILKDTHQAFFKDQKFGHCHPIGLFEHPPKEIEISYLYTLGLINNCVLEWDEDELCIDLSIGDLVTNMPSDWIVKLQISVDGIS